MSGPRQSSKSGSQARQKPSVCKERTALDSRSDSDDDSKVKAFPRRRILVICNDPDATESSSDEEERAQPKRCVTEIFIPAYCSLPISDSEGDLEKSWSSAKVCSPSHLSIGYSPATFDPSQAKDAWPKRISAKKLPMPKKGKGTSHTRKSSQSASVRRQGKSAAGIYDAATGLRTSLDTHDSAEARARACDMSAKKMKARELSTDFNSFDVWAPLTSSTSTLNAGNEPQNSFQNLWSESPCLVSKLEDDLDYDSFMKSPSSVLDNAPCDDCDSPQFFAAGKACSEFLIEAAPMDLGNLEEISAQRCVLAEGHRFERADVVVESSVALEGMNIVSSMEASSFLDEATFIDDFGRVFEIEGGGSSNQSSNQRACLLDPVGDELLASEDCLGDLPWDLDPEVLAWINVPEGCGV